MRLAAPVLDGPQKCCAQCGQFKFLTEFAPHQDASDGRQSSCRECRRIAAREATWRYALKRCYNLTPADYEAMLADQDGVCAICGGPPNGRGEHFYVDHDHETNDVRGLLCCNCNSGLGHFKEDPAKLQAASDYLRTWNVRLKKT